MKSSHIISLWLSPMFININILDHMFHNCFNLKLEKKTSKIGNEIRLTKHASSCRENQKHKVGSFCNFFWCDGKAVQIPVRLCTRWFSVQFSIPVSLFNMLFCVPLFIWMHFWTNSLICKDKVLSCSKS